MASNVRQDEVQISVKINGKEVKNTLKDLRKEARLLKKEMNKETIGAEEFERAAAGLKDVEARIKKAAAASKNSVKDVGLFAKAWKVVGPAIKAALGPLLALTAFTELARLAKEVFSITQEFQKAREEINRFTGLTGKELDTATAKAISLAETFEVELQGTISAANTATKNFGGDISQNLETIAQGLAAVGPDGGNEFLEQIQEYSSQAEKLGLTFDQTAAIIARGNLEGVFTDKAIDAVKEFNLRINDLSTGQREVLVQNFGEKFVQDIDKATSTADKLELVSLGLAELDKQGKALEPVIAAAFGGPGEDAGDKFLISLQNIRGGCRM